MANEVFKLMGSIFVNNDAADKALDQTTKKGETAGSKLGKAFGSIAKGAAIVGTAAVAGATALGTAAYKMATDTSAAGDRVDKMSQKMGMSRQGFQEWDYIMSQSGMSIDSAGTAMKSMTAAMADLDKGGKKGQETLAALGVTTEDLKNLSQEDIFEKSIKALQSMPDGYEKAALASELFGKQGRELLPLINGEAGSIDELKKAANDLGMVMGDSAVDGAVKLTDSIDTFKRSMDGAKNKLGAAVMPLVQKVMDMLIDKMPVINKLIEAVAPVIAAVFEKLLPPLFDLINDVFPILMDLVMALLPPLMDIITAILPVVVDLIKILLPPIIKIVEMVLPLLIKLIEPLMPLLEPILMLLTPMIDLLMMIITPLVELLDLILPPLIKVISWLIEKALVPLQRAFELVSDLLGGTVKFAFAGVKNYVDTVINVFKGIIDFIKNVFTGNWKGAWDAIKNIFTSIFDGIKGAFKLPINWIIDGINAFIKGINKVKIPDWVPVVGGKGFQIPEMQRLAVGTKFFRPNGADDNHALVGERGPEIVELPTGAKVRTADESKEMLRGAGDIHLHVNIANFNNNTTQDLRSIMDELMSLIYEYIDRRGGVFA